MKKSITSCETCAFYAYDDDYDCYFCEMSLDEDEMMRFMQGSFYNCPYWRNGDEYAVVRKQNQEVCYEKFVTFLDNAS